MSLELIIIDNIQSISLDAYVPQTTTVEICNVAYNPDNFYLKSEVDTYNAIQDASISAVSGDFVQEASLGTSFYNNGTSIDVSTSIHWNGYQISVIDTSAFDSGSALGNTIYFLRL